MEISRLSERGELFGTVNNKVKMKADGSANSSEVSSVPIQIKDLNTDNVIKEGAEQPAKAGEPELSALAEERRKLNEERERQIEERREREALEKAKQALAAVKGKVPALHFDTAEKFDDAQIIKVIDTLSDELIRQIPNEELLRVSAAIAAYKERQAHIDMITDPQLKARGVSTPSAAQENMRGVVFDDVI